MQALHLLLVAVLAVFATAAAAEGGGGKNSTGKPTPTAKPSSERSGPRPVGGQNKTAPPTQKKEAPIAIRLSGPDVVGRDGDPKVHTGGVMFAQADVCSAHLVTAVTKVTVGPIGSCSPIFCHPLRVLLQGKGTALLYRSGSKLCYNITTEGVTNVTSGAILRGARNRAGPVAVPLFPTGGETPASAAKPNHAACIAANTTELAQIARTPASYYVQVFSEAHPLGAVRGQVVSLV